MKNAIRIGTAIIIIATGLLEAYYFIPALVSNWNFGTTDERRMLILFLTGIIILLAIGIIMLTDMIVTTFKKKK